MASGPSMQLAKQIGEYLTAAELCRRGYVAATFSGNVPHYDILASDMKGSKVAIQVKSIRGYSWQFDARKFINIMKSGKRQVPGKLMDPPYPDLFCVFVTIDEYGSDQFYIFKWTDLQKIIVSSYKEWLKKHNGVRPKNEDSYHSSVSPSDLVKYKDKWEVITGYKEKSAQHL